MDFLNRWKRSLKNNWKSPYWWKSTIIQLTASFWFNNIRENRGEFVMEKDWDNLIILDACRYDLFNEVYGEEEVGKAISRGAATPQWLEENFKGKTFHDTVYITSNPFVNIITDEETFHRTHSLWKTEWDEKLGTVKPEKVRKKAEELLKNYQDKRIIIHFMQPHYPFLGNSELGGSNAWELDDERVRIGHDRETPWDAFEKGHAYKEEIWAAYKENLELGLNEAEKLKDNLKGKTVISSDHGNLLGEKVFPLVKDYGHTPGVLVEGNIKVPWVEFQNGERKEVKEDAPENPSINKNEKIKGKLEDLGYM